MAWALTPAMTTGEVPVVLDGHSTVPGIAAMGASHRGAVASLEDGGAVAGQITVGVWPLLLHHLNLWSRVAQTWLETRTKLLWKKGRFRWSQRVTRAVADVLRRGI
jgi:hypothetical protein